MQKFAGISSDTDATAGGMSYVVNGRYGLDGELARRMGLAQATASGGTCIANAWSPSAGTQILLFTTSGTIELVTL